ncbi:MULTISPECIES: DUF6878 family protein [Paraburkholderia]|uniref:DUF6878 domain-containing protein n=1 Tax=Paraburkholderia madseniana TaxID=2599607 RepID=A0AAP5BHU2_9BURK|nr:MULTISPECIES: DUF6878 family protein [Paraburkholderia]MCX4150008.1 hypothetical protein [Paraburkholderia madseniana]MCX4177800.1 hypothetical protein [Paraburkholderia madseniana]MDN7152944.1 hypothetical protein [Paraburkholderia sp. WS6]MDQ6411826.1 hypothetical protein [Paraburkholderia madseniana]MDQ6465787.1 hypothetical protein [Paraburkholderia madseniana]
MSDLLNQPRHNESDCLPAAAEKTPDLILSRNKPVLIDALRNVDASGATVCYSGSGDSGNDNEVSILIADGQAFESNTTVTVTTLRSQYVDGQWQTAYVEETVSLTQALSDYADRAIEVFHSGFEDGEGGSGEVDFVCETGTVTLDHRDYYVESAQTVTRL